jgi:hypothetical protein
MALVIVYLTFVEFVKSAFYRAHVTEGPVAVRRPRHERRVARRAARFSRRYPLGSPAVPRARSDSGSDPPKPPHVA